MAPFPIPPLETPLGSMDEILLEEMNSIGRCLGIERAEPPARRGCWILSTQSEIENKRGQATIFLRAMQSDSIVGETRSRADLANRRPRAARRALILSTFSGSEETVSGWPT